MLQRRRRAERYDVAYEVSYWPSVAQDVATWGLDNADFVPTLDELLNELETNPKQYPAKHDELAGARAADVEYRGQTWRVVFDVDDDFLEVFVLAIGPHDQAYRTAARRRRR
jgi:mRNA-degrading endonuclease RelE of RelBE toxin-antitoxin system